jgi:hypothetical protein
MEQVIGYVLVGMFYAVLILWGIAAAVRGFFTRNFSSVSSGVLAVLSVIIVVIIILWIARNFYIKRKARVLAYALGMTVNIVIIASIVPTLYFESPEAFQYIGYIVAAMTVVSIAVWVFTFRRIGRKIRNADAQDKDGIRA